MKSVGWSPSDRVLWIDSVNNSCSYWVFWTVSARSICQEEAARLFNVHQKGSMDRACQIESEKLSLLNRVDQTVGSSLWYIVCHTVSKTMSIGYGMDAIVRWSQSESVHIYSKECLRRALTNTVCWMSFIEHSLPKGDLTVGVTQTGFLQKESVEMRSMESSL